MTLQQSDFKIVALVEKIGNFPAKQKTNTIYMKHMKLKFALLILAPTLLHAYPENLSQSELPGEKSGILKIYNDNGHHMVVELHTCEHGEWEESSYSLYPKTEDEEAQNSVIEILDWAHDQSILTALGCILLAKAIFLTNLTDFSAPGEIKINAKADHETSTDYYRMQEVSFVLSSEQVTSVQNFIDETIESFKNGSLLYSHEYNCHDFAQKALESAHIEGHFYDYLPELPVLSASKEILSENLNIQYQKHGIFSAIKQVLAEYFTAEEQNLIPFSGEPLGELFFEKYPLWTVNTAEGVQLLNDYPNIHLEIQGNEDGAENMLPPYNDRHVYAPHQGVLSKGMTLALFQNNKLIETIPLDQYSQEKTIKLKNSKEILNEVTAELIIKEYKPNDGSKSFFVGKLELMGPPKEDSEKASFREDL
ncbi:MAG: hypothetical protein Tsb0018_08360 [Opitutales bacterium]